jgi:4-hydroxybenzoate polyprenyltransferase/phosphoserine phosphatase
MTGGSLSSAENFARAEGAAANAPGGDSTIPLVVDVDGTLIRTDLLQEAALQLVARHPFDAWRLPFWLSQGKSTLKTQLARFGNPGTATVPLRDDTIALIREAQRAGRMVCLASASERGMVEALAARVGGIDRVFATDASVNLAGAAKAEQLVAAFGAAGFDYVGDDDVDFPVWRAARKALVITHNAAFERRVLAAFPDATIVSRARTQASSYLRALRPHQWAKNALVFLPLLAGHFFGAGYFALAALAFVCFSMAASSAYIINDLLDLRSDRDDPRKSLRPFAAGAIPVHEGIILAAGLAVAAFAVAAILSPPLLRVLVLYFVSTLAYSLVLKRRVMIDVVMLGGLYSLRVLGGVAALGVERSPWLLMFCLFLFLSLAITKRCSELIARMEQGKGAPSGRGYREGDLQALFPFGAAAGYGAVLIVTLYLSSEQMLALYRHPFRLWLVCPLLIYWISRVFILSSRGELHDDPVVFALTDRVSWLTALCVGLVMAAAL